MEQTVFKIKYQHNTVTTAVFENASESVINDYLHVLNLNYNEIDYPNEFRTNAQFENGSQFNFFTKFILNYARQNNLQTVNFIYNAKQYQIDYSLLWGAWCAYFIYKLFNNAEMQLHKYIDVYYISNILSTHFAEVNNVYPSFDQREIHNNLKIFIESHLWNFLDDTAKTMFKKDFLQATYLQKEGYLLNDILDKQSNNLYPQKDVYEQHVMLYKQMLLTHF